MSKVVLDASAMLLYAREEPGWKAIDEKLDGALMSAVNYSEVLKKSIEYGGTAAAAASLVLRNRVEVVDFDAKQGHAVAELWAAGKPLGLSFADRACLALALSVSGTVYAAKRAELYDRQAGLRLQLEASDRDGHQVAELAIKAFELSQSLEKRWNNADYNAKRTILSMMLGTVRLNCENLEFSLRKPFDLLRDDKLVPLSGGGGESLQLKKGPILAFLRPPFVPIRISLRTITWDSDNLNRSAYL